MSEPDEPHTRIIRRQPSGPIPQPEEPRTSIIRRAPTGPIPAAPIPAGPQPDSPTTNIPRPPIEDAPTGMIRRATPVAVPARPGVVDVSTGRTAIAASAVSIVSGWATAVVATDLITGWWHTDRLFCLAVGFLTLLFALSTIAGVITLLLRRSAGRYLIAFGSVIALLTFGSVFVAGARIPLLVCLIPALPVASLILALHPSTRRWCRVR
ncbi:hypothetical protein [Mycolicibacterium sphagni]|uniref:Uncharacterized protein n=1 Tax=Mycolicibacterium sphagni TaxID=1786 RepID=A0ABX2K217_9MYCO|nr:hypothetical protein [Mycolicibacterium sphagni]